MMELCSSYHTCACFAERHADLPKTETEGVARSKTLATFTIILLLSYYGYLIFSYLSLDWFWAFQNGLVAGVPFAVRDLAPAFVAFAAYFRSEGLFEKKLKLEPLKLKRPRAYAVFENLSEEFHLQSAPQTYVVESENLDAFTFGRRSTNPKLVLSTGLIDNLTEDELIGVIAHELGHVRYRDFVFSTWASALIDSYRYYAPIAILAEIAIAFQSAPGLSLARHFVVQLIVIFMIPYVVTNSICRTRERIADMEAIKFSTSLPSALAKVSVSRSLVPFGSGVRVSLSSWGSKTKSNRFSEALFATHPPINQRLAYLACKETKLPTGKSEYFLIGLLSSVLTIVIVAEIYPLLFVQVIIFIEIALRLLFGLLSDMSLYDSYMEPFATGPMVYFINNYLDTSIKILEFVVPLAAIGAFASLHLREGFERNSAKNLMRALSIFLGYMSLVTPYMLLSGRIYFGGLLPIPTRSVVLREAAGIPSFFPLYAIGMLFGVVIVYFAVFFSSKARMRR